MCHNLWKQGKHASYHLFHYISIPQNIFHRTGTQHNQLLHSTDHSNIMPSSHRRHRQHKTILSCLVDICGVNWIGDKSRLSATDNFETVLSSLEMRCELSLVLSWPSFQFATRWTWLSIVTSYWETGSRLVLKCVHTADETVQNCPVSNIFRTTENCLQLSPTQFTPQTRLYKTIDDYWKLSATVANSVHTADADKTRQSCLLGVSGVN